MSIPLVDSYNIRKIRGFGRVKEQSFSLIFVQIDLVVDGLLLYITNTVLHVAKKRISAGNRICTLQLSVISKHVM